MSKFRELAEQLAPIYVLNGWKWRNDRPPTADEIEETIDHLLNNIGDHQSISTGRLSIERMPDGDGDGYMISLTTTIAWIEADGSVDVDVS